jgi:RND family efflux transporter MFP subunit
MVAQGPGRFDTAGGFMRIGLVICLLATLGSLGAGCGRGERAAAANQPAKSEGVAIPVQVESPGRRDISAYFETTTRVQAENRVEVISKGMGLCTQVNVEEGDLVKLGAVLAELDKEELMMQILQTRVNVEKSKTALEIAETSLQEGIGSRVERDNARFAYDAALATLQAQEVQLKNQTILAPIEGVVTRRNIQQGMMVTTGVPAFSIVDPASYILPITPPEKELARLNVGQEARVSIDSCPGSEFSAKVRRINPGVDALSGTVKVILDFEEAARSCLREAAFARVRLVMETHPNALLVPKDALLEENARKYVMLVEEGDRPASTEGPAGAESQPGERVLTAERIEVQTGLEDSNSVEIVSGITEESRVITLGQHTLKPGSEVYVTNVQEAILSGAGAGATAVPQNTSAN